MTFIETEKTVTSGERSRFGVVYQVVQFSIDGTTNIGDLS